MSVSERSEEPCELPGLAQRPFAGRVLRSKTGARGGNPERRGPTMALVVCWWEARSPEANIRALRQPPFEEFLKALREIGGDNSIINNPPPRRP